MIKGLIKVLICDKQTHMIHLDEIILTKYISIYKKISINKFMCACMHM